MYTTTWVHPTQSNSGEYEDSSRVKSSSKGFVRLQTHYVQMLTAFNGKHSYQAIDKRSCLLATKC